MWCPVKVSRRDTCDRYYLISLFGFAVFLHRLHCDEEKGVYHNHPWSGISLIIGSYLEQRYGDRPRIRRLLHFLPATTYHRLELPNGPVWTIFFHFRRSNRWRVINEQGKVMVTEPWRGVEGEVTSYRPPETKQEKQC
jgi:hypothetical protein